MSAQLSRRTVLKGVGCAMGLPLLEAMLPARSLLAAEASPPVRMGFISFPGGSIDIDTKADYQKLTKDKTES